ncbi:MAG: F0F1 ATP synthase subunit gamma, partial [Nitrospira sp.]|nr:F0F1 ATP synthase subunit gamma [Nitrospira sp.]
QQVSVSLVGRKSIDFFRRRNWTIRQQWGGVFDRLSYEHALDIGQNIVDQYNEGTFDQLFVVYNE